MSDETYEGWTNRETWAVALWINNDQGWQESVRDALREAADEFRDDDCRACEGGETHPLADYPPHLAGERIRESVDSDLAYSFGTHDGIMPASLAADLIGDAMSRVDWTELGASFLTDLGEQS